MRLLSISNVILRYKLMYVLIVIAFGFSMVLISAPAKAQAGAFIGSTPPPTLDSLLPELMKAESVDKALSLFKPAPNKTQIVKSDYLLLDSPPIALAGVIPVHLMSEIPGTEFFLLLNTNPPQGESSFLAAQSIANLAKADIKVKIKLAKNTEILLLVRAGGKWYSVTNDVKVVTK
ncbi:thiosulfate oxidation carrier protein SoxY [Undibacterium sp. Jales W-56]|uniref:thiosulfate oxidation carrier protein SoxY n=1 Tax=Undibacterium sp. Jales W-56 TaxID=2897325 RepID=UPI0021D3379D|nr:thiosulfate oxidation carrier protein SoxY [Undibacterium sp. Jales W-56]MCU6434925.1 thiosulfate oxidation carrier protein SoxY [Undibacterium sp. Jales W-56]